MDIGTHVRILRPGLVIGHVLPQNRLDGTIDPDRPSLIVAMEDRFELRQHRRCARRAKGPVISRERSIILRLAPNDLEPIVEQTPGQPLDVVAAADAGELRHAIRYALVADEGFEWLKSYAAGEPGAWEELAAWDGRTDRPKPATVRDMTHG
jgi:hypothetical protein